MSSLRYLVILLSLFAMTACSQAGGEGGEEKDPADTIKITTENTNSVNNPSFGVIDDENRFPYLKVVDDTTTRLQAYTVDLQVSHQFPLGPVTSEKLYWVDATSSDENIGIFLHYFIVGREVTLGATQVRVDYFSKKDPARSHIDSIFSWTDDYFLSAKGSRVIKEVEEVPTNLGKPAFVREFLSVRADSLTPKYLAMAFIDFNDDYMVGVNLTAVDSFEFSDALPAYYHLLSSMKR